MSRKEPSSRRSITSPVTAPQLPTIRSRSVRLQRQAVRSSAVDTRKRPSSEKARLRIWAVWPLFVLYGVYVAATDGVLKAWVADHVDGPMAGTAYGIYAGLAGAALLTASVVGGVLWSTVSPSATFWAGAAFAAASLPALAVAARAGSRVTPTAA